MKLKIANCGLFAIGMVLLLAITVMAGMHFLVDVPYERFLAEEEKTIPLFDALNESVYRSLPLPDGVEEIKRYSRGLLRGSIARGRTLVVFYHFSNTTLENIFSTYNQFLVSNGWRLDHSFEDKEMYTFSCHKGTACIIFNAWKDNSQRYHLEIRHDYLNQPFSPKLPPLWILNVYEIEGRIIVKCP